jgi:hypothetical protein
LPSPSGAGRLRPAPTPPKGLRRGSEGRATPGHQSAVKGGVLDEDPSAASIPCILDMSELAAVTVPAPPWPHADRASRPHPHAQLDPGPGLAGALGDGEGRPGPCERVQDAAARVGGGEDEPLEQGAGFGGVEPASGSEDRLRLGVRVLVGRGASRAGGIPGTRPGTGRWTLGPCRGAGGAATGPSRAWRCPLRWGWASGRGPQERPPPRRRCPTRPSPRGPLEPIPSDSMQYPMRKSWPMPNTMARFTRGPLRFPARART